jgi:cytochrome P450
MLEPFGPNVASTEGELWRFHYKVTLPPFGESNNRLVWSETFRQTEFLMQAWTQRRSKELKADMYQLTLNIIAAAGFGKQLEWDDNDVPAGHELSFLEAMTGVVQYLVHILLLPKWLLRNSPWNAAARAHTEFEHYVRDLIAAEKEGIWKDANYNGRAKGNLLTSVLRASAEEAASSRLLEKSSKKTYFTDDEVLGNAFIFLLAGKLWSKPS